MAYHLLFWNLFYFVSGTSTSRDCRFQGFLYRGTKNITKSGLACQRWDAQSPHAQNYYVFSLAQENYCRNFDREEPWCFTSNSSVRWELCGVNVCISPCLNESLYTQKIKSQCLSANPVSSQFCSRVWNIVECLKNRIEIFSGLSCSEIELKSIALQEQTTIELLIGSSISKCIKPPCTDTRLTSIEGLVKHGISCNQQFPFEKSTSETLCRNFQRVANCVVSKISDDTNATCPTKDKISTAKKVASLIPQESAAVFSLCLPEISEFSAPDEDSSSIAQENGTTVNQAQLLRAIGLAIVVICFVILISCIIKTRKVLLRNRRKELLRLPSVPKSGNSSYESKFTLSNNPYNDPDYEMIEEQDESYEHLREAKEEIDTQNDKEVIRGGSYIIQNNADGTYLDVGIAKNESDSSTNVNPYLDLIDDSLERRSSTNITDELDSPERS